MAYTNGTLHYNLPQTVGTDVRDWSDTNQAFEDVDTALFGAVSDVATASSKVNALDEELNDASTGVVAQLGQAQTDIIGLDGRVQTLEGTVSNHTSQIADVRADCEDMICAFNETSSTSTHDYAIGDYFRYNDVLYIATAVINIGDTITPDTNCSTTNVTTELLDIKGSAVDKVGDLASLTTTDKSNCVAAINEVNNDLPHLTELTATPSTGQGVTSGMHYYRFGKLLIAQGSIVIDTAYSGWRTVETLPVSVIKTGGSAGAFALSSGLSNGGGATWFDMTFRINGNEALITANEATTVYVNAVFIIDDNPTP